ncbi:DsrE family protein [Clostridium sp. 'deep sea']|jgi:hypothetical protein|uniref:DsrE family protein n=1 Tax=Clostridium sp. 'deep sea' TaxID=2779445 RepID=UPI001FAC7D81|nr:DsrE family protein [Clostridium sp. 'deep sea']
MNNELAVLWTSADREVALKMVFMYTYNAKLYEWWDEVELIIWGPSSRLLAEDPELQNYVKKMLEADVKVVACKACSNSYGVTDKLEELGVETLYMGKPLTAILKSNTKLITF